VLGYFYESGTITAANPNHGAEWYRKAAAQDDDLAQWRLGQSSSFTVTCHCGI